MKKAIFTFGLMLMAAFAINVSAPEPAIGVAEITFETEVPAHGKTEQHANGDCDLLCKNTETSHLTIITANSTRTSHV